MSEEYTEAPRRGRPPRAEAETVERRRRAPGSLNRMQASNLGIPDECLDKENWHYHWINDQMNAVGNLSTYDDYDVVTMEELEENAKRNRAELRLNRDGLTSGSGSTISVPVDPVRGTKAVLMKKRLSFYEADYHEVVEARQALMEQVVLEGDLEALDTDGKGLGNDVGYVPKGNTLGDAGMRRKGPIPQRRL